MTTHTDLINFIAKKINAQSYLEIGIHTPANNFNLINVPVKIGVDPAVLNDIRISAMTSDEYFRMAAVPNFDIIFIDGLHHSDQVVKDIRNAWKHLKKGGVIILHDCNPEREDMTHVPRDAKVWNGDVFRAASAFAYPEKFTIDMDHGCMVIHKKIHRRVPAFDEYMLGMSFDEFQKDRDIFLSLVSVQDGKIMINQWT